MQSDTDAVKAANQRFYEAFGALDIQAMDQVWENSQVAMCIHPGWQPLVGWEPIRDSWQGIFDNTSLMHFNIQYINVAVVGDTGWVTCVENISSVLQGRASNFGVLATNIFVRGPSGLGTPSGGSSTSNEWRMIAHHASASLA